MLPKHYFYQRWRGLLLAGKQDCCSVNVLGLLAVVFWKDKPFKLAEMTFPRVLFIFRLHFCGEKCVLYMKHPGFYYLLTAVAFRTIKKKKKKGL